MGFFGRRTQPDEPDSNETDPPTPVTEETLSVDADTNETQSSSNRVFDTALGAGSVLEGSLVSDGNVRLDGTFKGTLSIKENVLVGITAEIEADIAAQNVSVAGTVRGDVSGKRVHLLATARVWGNIKAEALITEDGAFIQGQITMETEPEAAKPPEIPEADIDMDIDELDEDNLEDGGLFSG
jgi:cytoskeletal protein CcmA (bactofilin family)